MNMFIQNIIEVNNEILVRMGKNKDITMRADDWRDFKTAKKCFICGKDFKEGDLKEKKLETIATLQVSIGDVPTMIVLYSFQGVIAKFQFSFITSRTMTVFNH